MSFDCASSCGVGLFGLTAQMKPPRSWPRTMASGALPVDFQHCTRVDSPMLPFRAPHADVLTVELRRFERGPSTSGEEAGAAGIGRIMASSFIRCHSAIVYGPPVTGG